MSIRSPQAIVLGLALSFSLTAPVLADSAERRGYVAPAELAHKVEAFPAAPVAGSPEDLADKAASARFRSLENTERWLLATTHSAMLPPVGLRHFDCALGYRVDPAEAPTLTRLYTKLLFDANGLAEQIKVKSPRLRPIGDDLERPSCERINAAARQSSSYPSGSASLATAYGEALAVLVPEKAEAVRAAAHQVALSRLVCGMHYPTDVAVGVEVGKVAFGLASATPEFAEDLAAARLELAAAQAKGDTSPACAAERSALAIPLP